MRFPTGFSFPSLLFFRGFSFRLQSLLFRFIRDSNSSSNTLGVVSIDAFGGGGRHRSGLFLLFISRNVMKICDEENDRQKRKLFEFF
jgi:hypothetical protein